MPMTRHLLLLTLFLGTPSVLWAAPQLDLPSKRSSRAQQGSGKIGRPVTSNLGGDVSGPSTGEKVKVKALVDAEGRPIEGGQVTTRSVNVPVGAQSRRGSLSIPSEGRRDQPPLSLPGVAAPPEATAPLGIPAPAVTPLSSVPVPVGFPSTRNSARFLYEQLLAAPRVGDPAVAEAADRLARLGADGVEVARFALRENRDVLAYAGGRALIQAGSASDGDDVVRLLQGKMPGLSAPPTLEFLVANDPVRGNTELLAKLLRHDSGPLRRTAKRELRPKLDSKNAGLLGPALTDRRSDVRRAATELLAGLEGPEVNRLLVDRVSDRSSGVAAIAVRALRGRQGDEIDFELLRRAMERGEILRREAMLLIAITEREDRQARAILGPQHTAPLVRGLQSPLPLVQASCAVALAGIGFRSPRSEATRWLDVSVPSVLVGVAAGFTFFDGFEVVRDPALRRLRRITGVSHGSNGPAWARWWSEGKIGFRASRSVIEVSAEEEQRIVVTFEDLGTGSRYILAGRALASDPEWMVLDAGEEPGYPALARLGEVSFLTAPQSTELCTLLREEGVFSAELLPGPRGAIGTEGRQLRVATSSGSKSFRFGVGRSSAWFDRTLVRLEGLREQNSWQHFPVAGEHADAPSLFLEEVDWWAAAREPSERTARLKSLVLRHLLSVQPDDRDEGLAELVRISASGDVLVADDIPPMLDLLVDEPRFNNRSRSLVDLLRTAAASGADELSAEVTTQIIATLHDRFGPSALPAIRRLLAEQGREAVLVAAVDRRGLLRVAAAGALGEGEEEQDLDLLVGLLGDRDPDVQVAAILALGARKAEAAQGRVLALTESEIPMIRTAALRSIGRIGGPGAIDALVRGITSPDERYHLPAAEGLATIGDVEAAPLLVSLLRGSSRPSIRAQARTGLLQLGALASDEVFSAMRSPDSTLRREAALLLARQLEPRAVNVLARTLAEDPDDVRAGEELVILTCVDYRSDGLPAESWFQWWDEVDRRDPFSWFLAALERRNIGYPPRAEFDLGGTKEARLFLLSLIAELPDRLLAERARRELERLHGELLEPLPLGLNAVDVWVTSTREIVAPAPAAGPAPAPAAGPAAEDTSGDTSGDTSAEAPGVGGDLDPEGSR